MQTTAESTKTSMQSQTTNNEKPIKKEEKQDYKGVTNRATYVPMYSIPKKFAQARQRKNLR